jgi:polyhydroxyalkanoate synthesis regulator phasin
MAITIEDIRNGIAENPELKTSLLTDLENDSFDYIKGKGFIVRTQDEQVAWEKQFEDTKIKPRVSELYNGIEKDFLEAFGPLGIAKDGNNEKIYDLVKKGGIKVSETIKALNDQITTLQEGKHDEVTKKQIEALQGQVNTLSGEKEALISGYAQKELNWKVASDINKAFSELTISVPATVSEKDKQAFIEGKVNLLSQALRSQYQVVEQDGKIVYTDNDGNIQMNGANVATAKDLLNSNFKYDFEANTKGGSGSSGSQASTPTVVQNKEQLYSQLQKEGLILGSKPFIERANELAKANGITL